METVCVNFHDDSGTAFSKFKLRSGDDAGDVRMFLFNVCARLGVDHLFVANLRLHGKNTEMTFAYMQHMLFSSNQYST